MTILKKIFGNENEKYLKRLQPLVDETNKLEPELESFSEQRLEERTQELKEIVKQGKTLDDILPQAFALVREAARRTLEQRHFDVQLIGGTVLHQGNVAEMRTGEGKTLAATLPAYLNALKDEGVHIVTVNDYLTKRDMVWMGQIYHALGLSVGCLVHDAAFIYDPNYQPEQSEEEKDKERDTLGGFRVVESYLRPVPRKEAYQADIVYGTNHEFGFDYLRDNMAHSPEQRVQRGLNYAIIDEVDSVLIDEARTPMIISAPDMESSKLYQEFSKIIPKLKPVQDYEVHEKEKAASLTDAGIERIEKILGLENIYQEKGIRFLHHLEQALRAEVLFRKDIHYVIKDNQIIIVDEFTGRLMPGRRWSGGLHQAVEAKEGINVQPESLTLASISLQNYFRLYKKLAGMTGTAATSAEEFGKVYKLIVVIVPTNKPMIREDLADVIYKTEQEKVRAIVEKVKIAHQKGQPVLIGTRSIEKNELLGRFLEAEGIAHQILNAKNHRSEGEIIAQAGRSKAVTVATNMAGRGVDIILGGNPPKPEEVEKVKQSGGLFVIGTERHEARRIDNQLRGRAGRQGDAGSSQFFLSLEDDLMRIFGGDKIKALMKRMRLPEGQPIQAKLISRTVESAQSKIEGMNFDARKHLLEYDDVANIHRNSFYKKRDEILGASNNILREKVLEIFKKQGKPESHFLKKEEELGEEFSKALRFICLRVFDSLWINHLTEMDYLKDRVRLRAYGQLDPLVEYKNESYKMFQQLLKMLETDIIQTILKISVQEKSRQTSQQESALLERSVLTGGLTRSSQATSSKKPRRNEPCPCGSGKKYKKCCLPKFG